ncbi:MAG TPA: glycosyltransferase family 39 protein [Thermoflexales bacterium]|nr:glycosyltransferase family 39 protein [Thermoflexales bacterium]
MTALLLFVPLILLPMALRRHTATRRGAVLAGAVVFAGILAAITEILSAFHAFGFWPVLAGWVLVSLGLMGLARKEFSGLLAPLREVKNFAWSEKLLAGGIMVVLAVTCVIAFFAAPNNYDAMTYHMPRVMHWIQNGSVAHYPAITDRQLFNSPLAEFFIAHLQVLAGDDRFAAFPQWLAFAGCAIGVSEIARQLGADRRGQIVAAALSAALPMAILQSTSTQNDMVAAFFLVAVIHLGLRVLSDKTSPLSFKTVLLFALAVGLSLLTKATNFIFVLPFVAWVFISLWRKMPFAKWLMAAALTALVALGINAPQFARNLAWFGSPIAPHNQNEETLNQLYTPAAFVSNLVRTVSIHTTTPLDSLNRAEQSAITRLHALLGLSENDPRTTLKEIDSEQFSVNRRAISNNENYVGSQAQFLLFLIAVAAQFASPSLRKNKMLWAYLVCAALGFAALSFYIKWMPYNARFHLSFFVVISAYIAVVFSQLRWRWMGLLAAAAVMLFSAPWLARNTSHPLVGAGNVFVTPREKQMFLNAAVFEAAYVGASRQMAAMPCNDFGLRLGGDDWEYPLWVLPRAYGKTGYTLRLADGSNCGIISSAKITASPGANFSEVWRGDLLVVYARR